MAYRVFRNELTYEQPNIEIMPGTLNMLQQLQQQKFIAGQKERERAAQQEKDLMDWHYSGKISQHSRALNDAINDVVQNHLKSGATSLSPETRSRMAEIKAYQGKADSIAEELNRLKELEVSKQKEDPYYRPQISKLEELVSNAGEGLEGIDKIIPMISEYRQNQETPANSVETFNQPQYLADYVKSQGEKQNANEYVGPDGIKHASDFASPFYLENGMPGVSNEAVASYLQGHPSAQPYYQQKAGEELMKQIKENQAGGWHQNESIGELLPRVMSDELDNPNPNAKPYNQIMFDLAKKDLWNQAKVHQKISTDYSNASTGSKYGIVNKNISATPGWNDNVITGSGPAMTVINSKSTTSPYITFDSEVAKGNKRMVDGKLVDNPYPRNFKLQNFQWGAKTQNGGVYKFSGKTADEMIKEIKALPASEFDPKNPNAIKSSSVIFNGQSIDKKTLDLAYAKRKELDAKVALNPTDENAKSQLSKLDQTLEDINAGRDFNDQLMQQLIGSEIVHNESFPVDPNDKNVQFIEGSTGMNVYSKKAMTEDMMRVKDEIDKRIQEVRPEIEQRHKEFEKTMKEEEAKKTTKKPSAFKSTYQLDGKDVSLDVLRKDYSDEEIQQAIAKGILK